MKYGHFNQKMNNLGINQLHAIWKKCRLADSESYLNSEIRYLTQKIKTYDDEKESKTETINEIRNYTKHIVCSQKKVIEPNGALNTE